jgi:hypothetical protein
MILGEYPVENYHGPAHRWYEQKRDEYRQSNHRLQSAKPSELGVSQTESDCVNERRNQVVTHGRRNHRLASIGITGCFASERAPPGIICCPDTPNTS